MTQWPSTAALSSASTPYVVAMDLIATNFSMPSIPEGIYHADLAQGMNFLLYKSNLTTLPEDIGAVWGSPKWILFWLEDTDLEAIPASLRELHIQKLALMGNDRLTTLPDDVSRTKPPRGSDCRAIAS